MKVSGWSLAAILAATHGCESGAPPLTGDAGVGAHPAPRDAGEDGVTGDSGTSDPAPLRAACAFGPGARATETLGLRDDERARIPITHIVVVMKENRSFDHLLGQLSASAGADVAPAGFTNPDTMGVAVGPMHAASTCLRPDPGHQWDPMHIQIDGGKMDGFIVSAARTTPTDGHFVMSYYDRADLPFTYWLASTFALNDRHFSSARSGTFPNRDFLLLGTADGVRQTGAGYPDPATPTIFTRLDAAGVSWGAFADGAYFDGALNWPRDHPGGHPFADFIAQVDEGTLPQVAFVDGHAEVQDDHPPADVQVGESWTRMVYQHLVASPLWPHAVLIWTYDEGGGFFDHVAPPEHACVPRLVPQDAIFFELGVRVPLVVISPWARSHFVSHVVQEHTAIVRLIETIFDLPALTARDANSPALLDLFDFSTPALLVPPAAPPAGRGGCMPTKGKPAVGAYRPPAPPALGAVASSPR
jgi:phospholipase C